MKKSGFVAIIGRPNVGKSTLLNLLMGETLAGVSSKPQTTRGMVRGILTRPDGQIVFMDTPGHHKPQDGLGEWMQVQIQKALEGADLIYWMVKPLKPQSVDEKIANYLKKSDKPVFLLINQIDKFSKPEILPVIEAYQKLYPFTEFIPISCLKKQQIDIVLDKTMEFLPEGPFHYPEDQISDQEERYFVQELIREQVFKLTQKEIPYATSVIVEKFNERDDGLIEIEAHVVVERNSQKKIIIGKSGSMMKLIGQKARIKLEEFLQKRVFLKLWVKVIPEWKDQSSELKKLGYQ